MVIVVEIDQELCARVEFIVDASNDEFVVSDRGGLVDFNDWDLHL